MVGLTALICTCALTIINHMVEYSVVYTNNCTILFDNDVFLMPLIAIMYAVAPFMCILIFRFLSTRKGSDFYHSLPVSRTCIYTSFTLAALAWSFIDIIFYTITYIISINIFAPYIVLDYSLIFIYVINIAVTIMAITAIVAFSCSISGTIFLNGIISVFLLFGPRLLLTIIFETSIVSGEYFIHKLPSIFGIECNLIIAFISELGSGTLSTIGFSTLYTLVLSLIYFFIGLKYFKKRPSETAGKPFAGKLSSRTYIILTGFIVSLINIFTFFTEVKNGTLGFSIYYIVVFLISILLMFVGEVINSKSIAKGFKACLLFPVVLVLDAITFLLISLSALCFSPEPIDKNDVNELYLESFYILNSSDTGINIDETRLNSIAITDKEIISIVIDNYNKEIKNNKGSRDYYNMYDYGEGHTLFFCLGNPTFNTVHNVYLTNTDIKAIYELLLESETYVSSLIKPIASATDVSYDIDYPVHRDNIHIIYEKALEEYNKLSDSDKFYLITHDFYYDYYKNDAFNSIFSINVNRYEEGEIIYFMLPILEKYTPEAYYMAISYFDREIYDEIYYFYNREIVIPEEY